MDISHFNAKLRELLPIDSTDQRSLADEDVEAISRNHTALEMLRSATMMDQQAHDPLAKAIRLKSIEERALMPVVPYYGRPSEFDIKPT